MLALAIAACREPSPTRTDVDPLLVTTDRGQLRGVAHGRAHAFLGIPYAAPPLADLRFRPPAPPTSWDGIRDATSFGSNCPQIGLLGAVVGDEDCLTLNVWRPAKAPVRPQPVLVFIHGGSNTLGSAADPHHSGRRLVESHDVIVVTMNYRLGLFGFLAHPELTAESGTSGNWAYLDQIAALDWVSSNIATFGGDPDRVTIVGESAGALSVCVLLASPLAAGLFDAAIIQSGGCDVAPLAQREREGEQLADASSCAAAPDPIACLRSMPVADLVALTPTTDHDIVDWLLPVGGAVDGLVLPKSPWDAFAAGTHNVVPTMVGSNANETELLVGVALPSCTDYERASRATFGASADEVLAKYPCGDYSNARYAYVHATTDALFTCQARRILRALAGGAGSTPLFRYYYAHVRADPALRHSRAYHGSEIHLLFGTIRQLDDEASENEQKLAEIMQTSWVGFAATGSPIHAATPTWTPYDVARDNAVVFDAALAAADGVGTAHCDTWDRIQSENR
jgi:para-nitrobenzyl esterase